MKAHITSYIMRSPLPTRSYKEENLNKSMDKEVKKKMEPRKKDQFAILKQYNNPLYKLNIDRWLRNGKELPKIVVWLEKRGYLNLKADAKVHYEQHAKKYSTALRYNDSFLDF